MRESHPNPSPLRKEGLCQILPTHLLTTDDTIAANETNKLINEAIQQLPPQQRTVYELSKLEGLSYDEIAVQMQLSRNTVRNHLAEAMKSIRVFLKKAAVLFISLAAFLID